MNGHFRVDLDPDGLDSAASGLGRLPAGFDEVAGQVDGAGAAVGGGRWTGGASGVVIPEIDRLAQATRGFG